MIANQSLYWNSDKSKIVTEESPEQAFLLVGKGCEIPDAQAIKLGLLNGKYDANRRVDVKAKPAEEEPAKAEPQKPSGLTITKTKGRNG